MRQPPRAQAWASGRMVIPCTEKAMPEEGLYGCFQALLRARFRHGMYMVPQDTSSVGKLTKGHLSPFF